MSSTINAAIRIAMEIIMIFEGFSATVYECPGGYATIGYGHALKDGEENIRELTREQAIEYLKDDCYEIFFKLEKMVTVELTTNQMAALISFCYNVGCGAFQRSTLRRKINRREYAADEFLRWNRAGGRELKGLSMRRKVEKELFLNKGVYAE